MTRVRRTARRKRRGFTLIEVMVSLGVMTVGAMAILALQQHSIRSNSHARQLTIGMQIAQQWVERLKQDSATWNAVGLATGVPSVAQVLGTTTYLRSIIGAPNAFQTIPGVTPTVSNAFDYLGNDTANDTTTQGRPVFYCASMRLGWVYFGRAMRADVRVWWPRNESGNGSASILTDFPACADDNTRLNPSGTQFNNYHVVYLPTVIRMTLVDN
jgi:prepilin-type N-terminal cleavage/methylation domain-containing protein